MRINVALACNNNFAYYCAETIVSLLINTKKDIFYNFYVIQDNLSDEYKNRILSLKNMKNCSIEFLEINDDNEILKNPMNSRLKLASLLPNIDKIIYTDCDVTFLDDLSEIWLEDFENYYTGNMVEYRFDLERNQKYFNYLTKEDKENYDIKNHNLHFNSGFMIMNLKKIREDDKEQEIIGFLNKYKDKSTTLDQDAINVVLYNKIKPVSIRWSLIISYYLSKKIKIKDEELIKDYKYSLKHPKCIHFVADKKPDKIYISIFRPFLFGKLNYYKKLFWKYVGFTDWKGEKTYKKIYKFPLNFLNFIRK